MFAHNPLSQDKFQNIDQTFSWKMCENENWDKAGVDFKMKSRQISTVTYGT